MSMRNLCLAVLFAGAMTGCSSSEFYGPTEVQNWMKVALANPAKSPAHERFFRAFKGDRKALNEYFDQALAEAESRVINAGEGITWDLQTIIAKIGDTRFSSVLAERDARVQSAVRLAIGGVDEKKYPKTFAILSNAPKIDFPLIQAYDGRLKDGG
jgi:hypothetical protein